jgi:hypothetical protein
MLWYGPISPGSVKRQMADFMNMLMNARFEFHTVEFMYYLLGYGVV